MVKLYVEGGGGLEEICRKGFTTFVSRAGIAKRPRVVACGSVADAYDRFCTAISQGEQALLLVDSEEAIQTHYQKGAPNTWKPWAHLHARKENRLKKPSRGTDTDCHLMVHAMENWFLADRETLKRFFSKGFREKALPAESRPVEDVEKSEAFDSLEKATRDCDNKKYGKGKCSFKLLEKIDPAKVMLASPWAKRFVDELRRKMG